MKHFCLSTRRPATLLYALLLLAASPLACAAAPGFHFSHGDWEIACDNTRTCRVAGYHSDANEWPMSVLLTRPGGPHAAVTGEVMLTEQVTDSTPGKVPTQVTLQINGQSHGLVALDATSGVGHLSPAQVAALLSALPRTSRIEWQADTTRWALSDQGAAAVLLKMDEFQGRLGTPGALMRKGTRSESTVPPALPKPVVQAAPLAKARAGDADLGTRLAPKLLPVLRATVKPDDCADLHALDPADFSFNIERLTSTQLLVSTRCWAAAYNQGDGYWVVDATPPHRAKLVTTMGTDGSGGEITASHKGRGIGDCWGNVSWVWNGREFVHTRVSTTGMCKALAAGGTWDLPTLVTDVKPASAQSK